MLISEEVALLDGKEGTTNFCSLSEQQNAEELTAMPPTITKYSELGEPPEMSPNQGRSWWLDTKIICLGLFTASVLACLLLLSPFVLLCFINLLLVVTYKINSYLVEILSL